MHVEEAKREEQAGIVVGYLLGYVLFTAVLFILFILIGNSWTYPEVMLLTGSIALLGIIIKKALK